MKLTERIRTLCKEKRETLASLERKLDFGNGTIRRWDSTIPSGEKLSKVADFFHVSVDYLLGNIPFRNWEEARQYYQHLFYQAAPSQDDENSPQLGEIYLRLARGAQELGLDEEDVEHILALYQKQRKRVE